MHHVQLQARPPRPPLFFVCVCVCGAVFVLCIILASTFACSHERWFVCVYMVVVCRSICEECFKWCMQRRAFGKALIGQPVVRQKLARMLGALEGVQCWLEQVTHQMNQMDYGEQSMRLAGTTSLLKYQSTRVAQLVGDDAVQLLGGRGITQTGMGRMVERFQRSYKFGSILGGSEEIMADLAIKMAAKSFPANARM